MKVITSGLLLLRLLSLSLASSTCYVVCVPSFVPISESKLCRTKRDRSYCYFQGGLSVQKGDCGHRRLLQQNEHHGQEERSMPARAEVVRTPAGTPAQQNLSEVARSGQCNFTLSSDASGFAAFCKRSVKETPCLDDVTCPLLRSTRVTFRVRWVGL